MDGELGKLKLECGDTEERDGESGHQVGRAAGRDGVGAVRGV